jgi:hypothetical protein
MNVAEIFDEIAKKMRSDFDETRKASGHSGFKGESFEEHFKSFLKKYLPKSLDVSTGMLVDTKGNSSRQLDVIISDGLKTPIFYSSGERRVIPVEGAYVVIEVKANLDTKELANAFKNMLSVKKLIKSAYYKSLGPITHTVNLYGKDWEIWPVNYYIFAYNSIDLNTLGEYLNTLHLSSKCPEYSRIDTICVLDKGIICNQKTDGMVDALPQPGSKLISCSTKRSLLLFYALISHYLNQVRLPDFRFKDYLGLLVFGDIE